MLIRYIYCKIQLYFLIVSDAVLPALILSPVGGPCACINVFRRRVVMIYRVQAYRRTGVQVYRYRGVQAYRCIGVQAYRRIGAQVYCRAVASSRISGDLPNSGVFRK
jgi:hypothetical protein